MAGRRFEVISDVTDVEAIAVGRGIRERAVSVKWWKRSEGIIGHG